MIHLLDGDRLILLQPHSVRQMDARVKWFWVKGKRRANILGISKAFYYICILLNHTLTHIAAIHPQQADWLVFHF